jgi:hypothetical protein
MEDSEQLNPEELKVAIKRCSPCKHYRAGQKDQDLCVLSGEPEEVDFKFCLVKCQKYVPRESPLLGLMNLLTEMVRNG